MANSLEDLVQRAPHSIEVREQQVAIDQPVDGVDEVVDDPELVGDLGTAEHHGIGPLGLFGEALEDAHLGLDEPTHGRRQEPRHVVDAGLLAVHDAEAVGDEDVRQRGELARELGAFLVGLGRLPRIEAQVLQHDDVAVPCRPDRGLGAVPHGVGGEGDLAAEDLPEAGRDRCQGVLVLGRALRAAEVGAHDDSRTRLGQRLDRGSGRTDATVVGDGVPVEGHIEVGADEHALAA